MPKQPALKHTLHWSGTFLALAGIAFVLFRLRAFGNEIDLSGFDAATWAGMFVLTTIYGLANLLLALGWWHLLRQYKLNVLRKWAIATYGLTQLAKYAPGNVFHLAGRQAIGMAAGLPGWSLAKSAVWELGLLCMAGTMLGSLALPLIFPFISSRWAVLGFAFSMGMGVLVLKRYGGKPTAWAFCFHCLFLVVAGLVFAGLLYLFTEDLFGRSWMELCGAYALAWLAGLLTPGAPAGTGVRELVLLFLLKGIIPEVDLLMAVVGGRLISAAGDAGFFGYAVLLRKSLPAPPAIPMRSAEKNAPPET